MYQGDRPDLTDKMNLVAQRQRRTLGTLATDVVARSSYSAKGDLVTGHGNNDPQAVPLGAEGMVLTAAPAERGGVRWVAGSGEVDSDDVGNTWEGREALTDNAGYNVHDNTALGFKALSSTTPAIGASGNNLDKNVAVGEGALSGNTVGSSGFENNVGIGYYPLSGYTSNLGYVAENVAIGWNANESSWQPCTISGNAPVGFQGSIAIGDRCGALSDSIAIGREAAAGSDLSAINSQEGAIALGVQANAFHQGAIAIGRFASAWDGTYVDNNIAGMIAIGFNSSASAKNALAIGVDAGATAPGTVAIGSDDANVGALASALDAVAVGGRSRATSNYATAVGYNAQAPGHDGVALGDSATASGDESTAVGAGALASGDFSTGLGKGQATAAGAVAIGVDHTNTSAISSVMDLIVLGTSLHTTRIPGLPAFAAGDKYLVVNSSGNIHKSALGPAS